MQSEKTSNKRSFERKSAGQGRTSGQKNRPSLDDYVDVAERIQDFKDSYPEGSLQTVATWVEHVEGIDAKTGKPVARTFIVYQAAAYRTPDDVRPGYGIAWEPFPGGTPYTRDSELMNAETAAWGRAICALGLVANRSLASRQEVRNRVADADALGQGSQPEAKPDATPKAAESEPEATETDAAISAPEPIQTEYVDALRKALKAKKVGADRLALTLVSIGVDVDPDDPKAIGQAVASLTLENLSELCERLGLDFATIAVGADALEVAA